MYFTTFALAALLSLGSAAPVANEEKRSIVTIKPTVISEYYVKTGRINYDLSKGHIYKANSGNGDDRTTLVTFDIPAGAKDKKCSLSVFLDGPSSTVSGSQLVDIFTSLAPAPGSRDSWGPGNQRDQHYGRLSVVDGGYASWRSDVTARGHSFTCPGAGKWAIELVGVYDNDEVSWSKGVSGPYITYNA